MSQYNLQQFIKLWAQEKITPEQAIGQILLQIQELSERIRHVEQQIRSSGPTEGRTEPQ